MSTPTVTKVGAAYRPETIQILDSHLALSYGLPVDAFRRAERRTVISNVTDALAERIRDQRTLLTDLRERVEHEAPVAHILSELRLADIVLWTSQDDRVRDAARTDR